MSGVGWGAGTVSPVPGPLLYPPPADVRRARRGPFYKQPSRESLLSWSLPSRFELASSAECSGRGRDAMGVTAASRGLSSCHVPRYAAP